MAKVKKRNGYFAIVLNERSSAALKALAIHNQVFCHHLTLAYHPEVGGPDDVAWSRYIGGIADIHVTGMAKDDKGQAVYAPEMPASNKFPHITVSCAEGVAPIYSNELLERVIADGKIEPCDMRLSGTIQFIVG